MCSVCALPRKAAPKMTYTVSGGMLNPTQSLTHSPPMVHVAISYHPASLQQYQISSRENKKETEMMSTNYSLLTKCALQYLRVSL